MNIIEKIYPARLKKSFTSLLVYSDIKINPESFITQSLVFSAGFGLAISLFIAAILKISLLISFIVAFIILQLFLYSFLLLKADARGRFVENVLPDALQLMSSNMRAGLTTDRALLLSARPEFGPLKEEINRIGKEITTGIEMSETLVEMSKHIKSKKLEKTMLLISSGLRAGGELTLLLEQTAQNLRQQKAIEDKVRSNVLMYVIFIFSAISFGAPMLFALSSFLVEIIGKNLSMIEIPKTTTLPLTISGVPIQQGFIIIFTLVSLITTSIFGSFVLGLISKGKESAGIKFIPILIACTLFVFFIIRLVIRNVFLSIFGI